MNRMDRYEGGGAKCNITCNEKMDGHEGGGARCKVTSYVLEDKY
jgi:hypothetical protein